MSVLVEEVRRLQQLPSHARARLIRVAAGVSQERLAIELGVDQATIARWESGVRRPRGQRALAYMDLLDQLREAAAS